MWRASQGSCTTLAHHAAAPSRHLRRPAQAYRAHAAGAVRLAELRLAGLELAGCMVALARMLKVC